MQSIEKPGDSGDRVPFKLVIGFLLSILFASCLFAALRSSGDNPSLATIRQSKYDTGRTPEQRREWIRQKLGGDQ